MDSEKAPDFQTFDRQTVTLLFKLLDDYKPEFGQSRNERLSKLAKARAEGKDNVFTKPPSVTQGVKTVTSLVNQKKALLVVIANDVDPPELVSFLPELCRKRDVPYCIVHNKSRLGRVVRRKNCACLALSAVNSKDKTRFNKLVQCIKSNFNDRAVEIQRGTDLRSKFSDRFTKVVKKESTEDRIGGEYKKTKHNERDKDIRRHWRRSHFGSKSEFTKSKEKAESNKNEEQIERRKHWRRQDVKMSFNERARERVHSECKSAYRRNKLDKPKTKEGKKDIKEDWKRRDEYEKIKNYERPEEIRRQRGGGHSGSKFDNRKIQVDKSLAREGKKGRENRKYGIYEKTNSNEKAEGIRRQERDGRFGF